MEVGILTGIILATVILFVTRLVSIEVTCLFILVALTLTGILTPEEALSGFSSQATVTVAAMFVLSAGLARTGVVQHLVDILTNHGSRRLGPLLLQIGVLVAIASAFANNTPVVVIMVPVILGYCRNCHFASSKVFLPLSYFAILGGTTTLIGTSTNILIDDLYRKSGGPGFGIFDFTSFGVVYLLVGLVATVVLAIKVIPVRSSLASLLTSERPAKFVTELVIKADTLLIGKTVGEVFGDNEDIRLLELIRGEEIILSMRAKDMVLEPNDAIIVEGGPSDIHKLLQNLEGVELASVVEDEQRVPMRTVQLRLVEAVVLPESSFVGRHVKSLELNRLYGVKVMAVQRHGKQHRYQIRAMRLTEGDVLLLQSDEHGLAALRETGDVLIVEGIDQTVHRSGKMPLAVGILAIVVILASVFHLPLATVALAGAGLMLITRVLRMDEAVRSIDVSTLLLLAGTIPLGLAMNKTGLAPAIVNNLMDLIGDSSPRVIMSSIYLLTAVFTSFLSNNATAVLLTPLAVDLAARMGIDPRPLLMAIAFGASACFSTPIGYQTNAIVMGPGGYAFSDYLRIGLPLTLVMWITATILLPVFWPF